MTHRTSFADRPCSLARALDQIGDYWTLLVVREVFYGNRHFTAMQQVLDVAPNVLADRLRSLVGHGILRREADGKDRRKVTYCLTEKGQDLLLALAALMEWGAHWTGDGMRTLELVDRKDGGPVEIGYIAARTGRRLETADIGIEPGPGWGDSRPFPNSLGARPP